MMKVVRTAAVVAFALGPTQLVSARSAAARTLEGEYLRLDHKMLVRR